MATLKAIVQNGQISLGSGKFDTMETAKTTDERIVKYFEARAWCHNVISLSNFNSVEGLKNGFSVDVEYVAN